MGKAVLWVIAGLFVIGVVFHGSGGSDSGSGSGGGSGVSNSDVGDEIGAQVVCEDFVKKALKSPSTADFSDEQSEHHGGRLWEVQGAVDSENGFGAPIRNNFTCSMRYTGNDSYRLLSLTGLTN